MFSGWEEVVKTTVTVTVLTACVLLEDIWPQRVDAVLWDQVLICAQDLLSISSIPFCFTLPPNPVLILAWSPLLQNNQPRTPRHHSLVHSLFQLLDLWQIQRNIENPCSGQTESWGVVNLYVLTRKQGKKKWEKKCNADASKQGLHLQHWLIKLCGFIKQKKGLRLKQHTHTI